MPTLKNFTLHLLPDVLPQMSFLMREKLFKFNVDVLW